MKNHKPTNRTRDAPDSMHVAEQNQMVVPTSQLSAQSHKQFLRYGPKGGQNTVAVMVM